MKRFAPFLILATFALTALAQEAPSAPPPNSNWHYGHGDQWDPTWDQRANPDAGACFFTERSYSGHHFCVRAGDRLPALPGHFGDHISSIQIIGHARARLFNDRKYRNGSIVIDHSIDNLSDVPFRGGHTWNKRISSIIVFGDHDRDRDHDRDHDRDNDSGGL